MLLIMGALKESPPNNHGTNKKRCYRLVLVNSEDTIKYQDVEKGLWITCFQGDSI